jgi:hypothetical protein
LKQILVRILFLSFLSTFLVACAAPADPVEIVQAFISAVDSEKLDVAYKLLADQFTVGYGGGELKTFTKAEVRPAAEKMFKDYNMDLEASNFQIDGSQVYFSIAITDEKDEKSATCSCEVTITDGMINRIIILFCNEP